VENGAIPQRFEDIEVVCIDIKVKGSVYRIIGYYRPPGLSTVDYEYIQDSIRCFQHLCSTHHTVVIMGDFNMPLVDWDSYSGPDNPMYSAFLHFINNYGLHQYVNKPPRGDIGYCSEFFSLSMQVTAPFSINDHNSVVFNVNGNEEDENTSSGNLDGFYDYAHANKDGLRSFLENVKWNNNFQVCFTVDACCEAFYDIFHYAIKLYVPTCHRLGSYSELKGVKYPRYVKKLMAKKTFLWRKWKALQVPFDYESYRMVTKECHQAVSKFHATVETNLIRKNNIGS